MKNYKLLTPGPLTTTETVKKEMLFDHCTWDDDYKQITQEIRRELLNLAHVSEEEYTAVLMQGSGTFGVESVLTSVIGKEEKLLIAANGAYGKRMVSIAEHACIDYTLYEEDFDKVPCARKIAEILDGDGRITHVAMVHSETTSGILNDISSVAKVVKERGRTFIVDAMSSFAGVDIPMHDWHIDFLVSSANKCIQGVPGFSFIIARRELLIASRGCARSLSLDLYDQWAGMEKDGKWRYTSPTHVVLAFAKAMEELQKEGGIPARSKRYAHNRDVLIEEFGKLGFLPYVEKAVQGPIITTFLYPDTDFDFAQMYRFIKERGYAIYPGKLTDKDTFRIGTIGEIYEEDILRLAQIMKEYMESRGN